MAERLTTSLNSLTAKYVAVFTLLVAVPAIGISWYLLDSSYNDNKTALIREQEAKAKALAGRIDQMLQGVLDRLGSVHGKGLRGAQAQRALRPLTVGSLPPLVAFYMNGRGALVASDGPNAPGAARRTGAPLRGLTDKGFEQAVYETLSAHSAATRGVDSSRRRDSSFI